MKTITLFFIVFTLCVFSINAQNIIWSDNFEGNWNVNWHSDAGTWEVGIPTSGPDSAYADEKCAATILSGNYSENVTSMLIRHTSFTVPSADQKPRLRFWQWYSFANNDYGVVMLKTSDGSWKEVSYQYWNTGSNVWSHAFIDLTEYAGLTVQIAFRFISRKDGYGRTYVNSGWYIDEVSLETGPLVMHNSEDWEVGINSWYAEHSIWEVGSPTSGPNSAHSGKNCAATVLKGNYTDNRSSRLVSPEFKLPASNQNPRLRFWHWFSFSNNDYGNVLIKTKNTNWTSISNNYTGTGGGVWTYTYLDLSAYADSTVQIAFNIHTAKDGYGRVYVSSGWYIDDVIIEDNSGLEVDAGTDIVIQRGESTTMNASVNGGTTAYSYEWTPTTGLIDANVLNPEVSPNDTTQYILNVTDANGCFRTDIVTVFVTDAVGTDIEKPEIKGINIYPNPANNYLYINNQKEVTIKKIMIYDITGKIIKNVNYKKRIDVSGLPNGLYVLKLETSKGEYFMKFLRQ